MRNTPYSKETQAKVVEYYKDNHSAHECFAKFGISAQTVRKYVRAAGIMRPLKESLAIRDSKRDRGPRWNGGRSLGYKKGYLSIYTGLENGVSTYRTEHLLVAERVLGRTLKRGEVVHHLNGNKLDNRNRNLIICSNSYHVYLHMKMSKLYQQEHFS